MSKLFKIVLVLYCVALSFSVQGQNGGSSTNSKNIFSEAFLLFEQKQYQAAQNLFETYLSTNILDTEKSIQAQYYICLTSLYLEQPEFKNRLDYFTHKYPNHPKSKAIAYHVGSFYFDKVQRVDYRKASSHLQKVATDNPKTKQEFSASYKLAYSQMIISRKPYEVIDYFKKITKVHHLNLHSQQANYYLGKVYLYEVGNYTEAAKCFHHALSEDNLRESAYNLLAKSYFLAEKYEKGKKYWDKIEAEHLKTSPELAKEASKKAFKMKQYADVIRFLNNIKTDSETQIILATSYLHLEEHQKAINTFLNILESPESDTHKQLINLNLGMAYLKMDNYDRASKHFKVASQFYEDETIRHEATLYWAMSASEAKDYLEATYAANHYQTNYRGGRHSEKMKEILFSSHQNLGNTTEALEYIKRLKNPSKEQMLEYQRLTQSHAEKLHKKKEYQKAMETFEASFKYKYRDEALVARAYFIMGTIAFERKMYAQTDFYYNKIPKQSVFFTETLYYKGYMARYQGKHKDALNYFFNYVSKDSKERKESHHLDALVRLADAYVIVNKDYPLAHSTYQQALEKGYRKPDYIFYNKGQIFLMQENEFKLVVRRELALRQFDHIIYKYPTSPYLYKSLHTKGLILKDQGKQKDALAVMSTLLGKKPPFEIKIQAFYERGELHSGLNKEKLAIQDYKSVLQLSSTDSLSKKAIRALNQYQNLGYNVENLAMINQRFEELNPESKTVLQIRFEKAEAFANNNNDIAELKELLKPFLEDKNSPYYNHSNYLIGTACKKLKDKSGTLEFYCKVQGQLREKTLLDVAKIQLERKNFNSSAEYYAEARHFFQDEAQKNDAFKGLIRAYEGMGEWDGLEQSVNELARQNNPNTRAFVRLYKGKILVKNRQYTEAIKVLGEAQFNKKNEDNAKIILLLGETFNLNGDYQKSNNLLTSFKKNYHDYQKALKHAKEIMDNNYQSLNKKGND